MKILLLSLAVTASFALSACAGETDQTADAATAAPVAADMAPAPAPMASEPANDNPMVGGAAMLADRDIVDNASQSADHTTLVAAVQAAGLVDTLKGAGPFTVFAPTNAAFEALPAGTVDTLLMPENQSDLAGILTYHVVSGAVDAATLVQQIEAGGGQATLTTVAGGELIARAADGGVTVTDAQGNSARVTTADVMQSNGVIHVIDTVLLP